MEVVFYQLFIAASIVATRYLKRESILFVCWGWSAFTLLNLFYPPLILIQLGVIWGSYFLLDSSEAKDKKISQLEELTKALPQQLQTKVEILSTEYKRTISGLEHFTYLKSQVKLANRRITILSGWLSSRVVDTQFLILLESRLKDGVICQIGYGWQDSRGEHSAGKDLQLALNGLRILTKKYPNQLHVAEYATHEKMLVIDSNTVVFGSANWLSNKNYTNFERSIVVIDEAIASSEEERISALIKANKVI
jgi:phosphatidylserine/phosphatidylglycerophosphate/cardiolipin synthase-like enzyme